MENSIHFIAEKDGDVERKFKDELVKFFLQAHNPIRAYLLLIQYENESSYHVMLAIRVPIANEKLIINCSAIFKSMFGEHEHLDIMYIDDKQEQNIRLICCPFYTSHNYQIIIPDFFLFSHEGYNLDDIPRACYKRKRLYGKDRLDDFMLCDISPSINGQGYGLGDKNINQIVIANRIQGTSLFPISEWPILIYVTRPITSQIESKKWVEETDIDLIAWATLYQRKEDIDI